MIWAIHELICGQTRVWESPQCCTKEYLHLLPPAPICATCACRCRGGGLLCRVPRPDHPCLGRRPPWVGPLLTAWPLCPVDAVRAPACWVVGWRYPAGVVRVRRTAWARRLRPAPALGAPGPRHYRPP